MDLLIDVIQYFRLKIVTICYVTRVKTYSVTKQRGMLKVIINSNINEIIFNN